MNFQPVRNFIATFAVTGKIRKNTEVIKGFRKFLFLLVMIALTNSCKDIQESNVPDIPFSFTINLVIDNELTIPGNSKYYPVGGYGGVIVYCELPDSYYAFDATCTYEVSQNCKVKPAGPTGECGCCKSQFIFIGTGMPIKSPAAAPLRQYQVSKINSFTLRVYN